jgi:hypothetical protein
MHAQLSLQKESVLQGTFRQILSVLLHKLHRHMVHGIQSGMNAMTMQAQWQG